MRVTKWQPSAKLAALVFFTSIVAGYGDALDDESVLELLRIAHPPSPIARLRAQRSGRGGDNMAAKR